MFDSQKELLDKVRLDEATFLELKEVRFAGGKVKGPGPAGSRGGPRRHGAH